jgi:fused signal recognition particle receptor
MSETFTEIEVIQDTVEMKVNLALQKGNVTAQVIAQLRERFLPLKINGQDDKEGYKAVVAARKDCKALRVKVGKICKEGREEAVIIQKAWVAKDKEVSGQIEEVETYLEEQENAYEAERERLKKEEDDKQAAIFTNRTILLTKMGVEFTGTKFVLADVEFDAADVKKSTEELFQQAIVAPFKEVFDKIEADRISEEARVQAENERIAAEKAESERVRIEAEQKLASEQAEMKRQQEEFRQQQEAFAAKQAEAERVENEKAAQQQAEAKQAKEAKFKARMAELRDYSYNGFTVSHNGDIVGSKELIVDMPDEEFATLVKSNNESIEAKEAEKNRLIAEQAATKERERIEAEQAASALKKQQEEAAEAEKLAAANDKTKWEAVLKAIKSINIPEMRSGQYRKKAAIAREKLEELLGL